MVNKDFHNIIAQENRNCNVVTWPTVCVGVGGVAAFKGPPQRSPRISGAASRQERERMGGAGREGMKRERGKGRRGGTGRECNVAQ